MYRNPPPTVLEISRVLFDVEDEYFEREADVFIGGLGSTANSVVLSDEGIATGRLTHDPISLARRLKYLFPDAHVLLVLRDQIDLINSFYSQQRYLGHVLPPIDKFIRKELNREDGGLLSLFDFDKIFAIYEQLFGRKRVSLCFFEDLVNRDRAFAEVVGGWLGDDPEIVSSWFRDCRSNSKGARSMVGEFFWDNLRCLLRQGDLREIGSRGLLKVRRLMYRDRGHAMSSASRKLCEGFYRPCNQRLSMKGVSLPDGYSGGAA